jgi:hypothetical protein
MKAVLQKLFQVKSRLEDAWASTRIDQADTLILGRPGDEDLCETVPAALLAERSH